MTSLRQIHSHFQSLSTLAERRHRRRQRIFHMAALLLDFAVLAAALLLRTVVADWPGTLGEVIAEGLLILAWVALWRPAGDDAVQGVGTARATAVVARLGHCFGGVPGGRQWRSL